MKRYKESLNIPLMIVSIIASSLMIAGELLFDVCDSWLPILRVGLWFAIVVIALVCTFPISELICKSGLNSLRGGLGKEYLTRSVTLIGVFIVLTMILQALYGFLSGSTQTYIDQHYNKQNIFLLVDASEEMENLDVRNELKDEIKDFLEKENPEEHTVTLGMSANDQLDIVIAETKLNTKTINDILNEIEIYTHGSASIDMNQVIEDSFNYIRDNSPNANDRIIIFTCIDNTSKFDAAKVHELSSGEQDNDLDSIRINMFAWGGEDERIDPPGIMLLSDMSGSMAENDREKKSIESIKDISNQIENDQYFGVAFFSGSVSDDSKSEYKLAGEHRQEVLDLADTISFIGGTSFEAAVESAVQTIENSDNADNRNVIILMSDGEDKSSIDYIKNLTNTDNASATDDIAINTVGFYSHDSADSELKLSSIAQETGGIYIHSKTGNFTNLYQAIINYETLGEKEKDLAKMCILSGGDYNSTNTVVENMTHGDIIWENLLGKRVFKQGNMYFAILRVVLLTIIGVALGIVMVILIDDRRIAKYWVVFQSIKSLAASIMFEICIENEIFQSGVLRVLLALCLMILFIPMFKVVQTNKDIDSSYAHSRNYGKNGNAGEYGIHKNEDKRSNKGKHKIYNDK